MGVSPHRPGTDRVPRAIRVSNTKLHPVRAASGGVVHVPDLPGCVATGKTPAIVRERIEQAITVHIASLREHGEPVPKPTTIAAYASVA
ncbi:MAG: type II toxin-antitoxin system HicB family antitoxin [Vulcanimicrobiaceae bacterium]